MSDTAYIYGDNNGASFTEGAGDPSNPADVHTHWDPRLEIKVIGGQVQIGVIPSSKTQSTDDRGVWVNDDGQFLTLSRSGLNRLIRAARECRDSAYGKDE